MTDNDTPNSPTTSNTEAQPNPLGASQKGADSQKTGTQTGAKPGAHRRGAKPNRSWGRLALWLLVLMIIGLPIAAGYGAWWVWEDMTQQRQQLQSLEERMSEQTRQLRQQSGTLNQLPDSLRQQLSRDTQQARQQQQAVVSGVEQRMDRLEQRLSRIASTDRDDWKLAEAEYLLRLANQRLVLERDSRNALALAETADNILRELGQSDLLPVRRTLASDIQALKLADQVDREGIYLRLQALGEQLPELPMVEPMFLAESDPTTDTGAAQSTGQGVWQTVKRSFGQLVQRLSNHIRIRRHNESIQALADPREQFIVRQQLQLLISQAQAALLREQTDLYQRSLNNAITWLETHYALNPQAESALNDLRALSALDIAPELPDLDEALNQIEGYSEERNRLSPRFQSSPEGDGQSSPENDEESDA